MYAQKQRDELKETVVGQQIKISKLKRRDINYPSNLSKAATPTEIEECSERATGEQVKKGETEATNKVTGGGTREAIQKAKEAREKAEREGREVSGRLGKEEKGGPRGEAAGQTQSRNDPPLNPPHLLPHPGLGLKYDQKLIRSYSGC